jgi:hypothetical protein
VSEAGIAGLAAAAPERQRVFVDQLTPACRAELAWWLAAHAPQRAPEGAWRTWVLLGGRGAGKTRAGAEWLSARAARVGRVALVGATLHDVRDVMVEGPSGLRRLPGRRAPSFQASRRRLEWADGAVGYAFSAEDPDSLRGPQFGAAWGDEFCAWAHPEATLTNLRLGLRLGGPAAGDADDHAPAGAGAAAGAGRGGVRAQRRADGGERRQSERRVPGGAADALRRDAAGGAGAGGADRRGGGVAVAGGGAGAGAGRQAAGTLERVVVAVDPPATAGGACGIVVAGRAGERAYVLADRTGAGAVARRVGGAGGGDGGGLGGERGSGGSQPGRGHGARGAGQRGRARAGDAGHRALGASGRGRSRWRRSTSRGG